MSAPTLQAVVRLVHVSKEYPRPKVTALRNVNVEISAGEFVAIVGPSGSGKSTLLHVVGGLGRPSSGDVDVNGARLTAVRDLSIFRLTTVGFVFQLHYLNPVLTAVENVEIPMVPLSMRAGHRRRRALALLDRVGLAERAHHLPSQLSGGESQRVAIARALANDPKIILADEPTGELDSETGSVIVKLLADLGGEGRTVLVATHDHDVAQIAHRVVRLRDGEVVDGTSVGVPTGPQSGRSR